MSIILTFWLKTTFLKRGRDFILGSTTGNEFFNIIRFAMETAKHLACL